MKIPIALGLVAFTGLISFMGAATTAVSALIAALAARIMDAGALKRLLLRIAILWPLDLVTYSIFPLFGLRHWILIGGLRPEPYEGALAMGASPAAYFSILGI